MGPLPDEKLGPVRLPPTLPPKRRNSAPRWRRPLIGALVMVLTAVGVSSALHSEVSKRLAIVPPSSTSPVTSAVVRVTTSASVPQVMGARLERSVATTVATTSPTVPAPPPVMQADTPSEIIAALEKLPVQEEADGYSRSRFGFYKDADNDGCATREEVAIAEAMDLVMATRSCSITSGKWYSPFDAATVGSVRDIDVAHLVPLREAFESGAANWKASERNAYLNDLTHPETMLVVSEASADARDDEDPGNWLPSNDGYLCDYLRTWVFVKTVYELSVDPGERESIAAAALHC